MEVFPFACEIHVISSEKHVGHSSRLFLSVCGGGGGGVYSTIPNCQKILTVGPVFLCQERKRLMHDYNDAHF